MNQSKARKKLQNTVYYDYNKYSFSPSFLKIQVEYFKSADPQTMRDVKHGNRSVKYNKHVNHTTV